MKRKSIRLNEKELREFVSYSVRRLLKEGMEAYTSRPQENTIDISFDPNNNEHARYVLEYVLDKNHKYDDLTIDMFMDGGQFDIWPVKIEGVRYEVTPASAPDSDEIEVDKNSYRIRTDNLDGVIKDVVEETIEMYMDEIEPGEIEEFASEQSLGGNSRFPAIAGLSEDKATSAHFPNKKKEEPERKLPTVDDLRKKKADEKKEEEGKKSWCEKDEGEPKNKGVTVHFGNDDLKEAIRKAVTKIFEGIGDDEEEAHSQFPAKASGTFTMRTRRGNVDKYKVYVEKTEEEELLTDIFVYDERGKEWEPQAEYVVGIEDGDVSIRALANCFDKVVKLWKKVGYLYDEDDEIPFRYGGDYMKGAPKGMF